MAELHKITATILGGFIQKLIDSMEDPLPDVTDKRDLTREQFAILKDSLAAARIRFMEGYGGHRGRFFHYVAYKIFYELEKDEPDSMIVTEDEYWREVWDGSAYYLMDKLVGERSRAAIQVIFNEMGSLPQRA